MMRPTLISLGLVLCLSFVTASCTYLQELVGLGVRQPKVQLVDLAVTKADFSRLDVLLTLRVDNPNSFQISFAKLRYQLTASGSQIATGTLDQHVAIPGGGQAEVKLPLSVDGYSVLKVAHDLLTKSAETFAVLNATAAFDTPFGAMEATFEERRPLRQLAGF